MTPKRNCCLELSGDLFIIIFSYRKDHLRKHTRSHIARRVKAELSQQGNSNTSSLQLQVSAPGTAQQNNIMS